MRWSTQNALSDTIKILSDSWIASIEKLSDIVTESDLKKNARKSVLSQGS